MSSCNVETQEKHMEIIHDMDKRLDKLITLQEITTSNIDKLTKDIKENGCSKTMCNNMFEKIRALEDKTKDIKACQDKMEHIGHKIDDMWFFVFAGRHPKMVVLMLAGLYLMAIGDVRAVLLKLIF